ncbi:hypothetical protein [Sphingomonas sp. SRS2]|uniref:hypothetical protein n=1 Tax=Sphingomonas sp. SRS2 TaxID=133190 RepID=UPI000AAA6A46|nr:hypothetical protein [Sphingomonas sp. SRS2]
MTFRKPYDDECSGARPDALTMGIANCFAARAQTTERFSYLSPLPNDEPSPSRV